MRLVSNNTQEQISQRRREYFDDYSKQLLKDESDQEGRLLMLIGAVILAMGCLLWLSA